MKQSFPPAQLIWHKSMCIHMEEVQLHKEQQFFFKLNT